MPIFKTPHIRYDIVLCIIHNLNKELVYGIAVDFNVLGYEVIKIHLLMQKFPKKSPKKSSLVISPAISP